jgi:RNA polymerase sigma-70 factor (ECF subfamily)
MALSRASELSDLDDLPAAAPAATASFAEIYRQHFGFVWRSAQRLGVPAHALDDVVQDVFLIVHRKLAQLEPGTSARAWLFTILRRVVRDRWRALQRSQRAGIVPQGHHPEAAAPSPAPDDQLSHEEAKATLYRLLSGLSEAKRDVFILAELEGLTAPEIASALECNLNTVYSRLRSARADFEAALAAEQARDRASGGTG